MLHPHEIQCYTEFKQYCIDNNLKHVSFNQAQDICNDLRRISEIGGYRPAKFHQLYNQSEKCIYCDCDMVILHPAPRTRHPINQATVDHILPKSKGYVLGVDYRNAFIACRRCNGKKGDKNVFNFMWRNSSYKIKNGHVVHSPLTSLFNDIILFLKVFLGLNKCY